MHAIIKGTEEQDLSSFAESSKRRFQYDSSNSECVSGRDSPSIGSHSPSSTTLHTIHSTLKLLTLHLSAERNLNLLVCGEFWVFHKLFLRTYIRGNSQS